MPNADFGQILDALPQKPPRSRLEPYRELILEMRRRGRTFREIAQVLGEKCRIHVVPSTVYDFVKAATSETDANESATLRYRDPHAAGQQIGSRPPNASKAEDAIALLKSRKLPKPKTAERFRFVSGEPLRIQKRTVK